MKKDTIKSPGDYLLVGRIFFFSIFLIILISWFYLVFFSIEISFSPPTEGMGPESALGLLNEIGQQGIDWYCGKAASFRDSQGNIYGPIELEELKKILGNEDYLNERVCK